ncbi:MAG: UDP-3-O-(3-hydroxymyristoyl)glucosamine N-acyltransferase [Bacteroidales bacterium]|nr:UDP-3-O-(3-hydroxymyristoyl)glucosamine N-acyltransferase [Bacteroidales bacterium]MDY4967218.1 UDP-3-O-(3-hydroxymyristoyl)glucosamine N-acyltransferase [Prevotella sp.]
MEFTAQQIAELIKGRVEGDKDAKVSSFAKIEEGHEGAISFLSNKKYLHYIYETKSSVVLVDESLALERNVNCTLIRVKSAYEAVAQLLQLYESMKPRKRGISDLAFIDPTATIGKDCYIGPFAYVGPKCVIGDNSIIHPHAALGDNVIVGKNTEIHSNAVIYHDCKVGNRCILHAGCVIGADGFGFAPSENGYDKIPQIGIVTIEDDVEIGANTCVDRSTMGSTFIRNGVKLDNLVQIAHNTDIGANTVMSSQVGVAGSTKVGEWCMFGGQVGISGHITIGNKVMLGAQSGVPGSIKDGQQLIGTPPMEMRSYFKSQAIFRRLPEMYNEINKLRKEIEELKANKE